MKINVKSLSIILFVGLTIIFTSCSKDKKIEKRLTKGDGVWNVKSVSYTKVSQSSGGQSVSNGTAADAGTFTFNSGGNGSFSYTADDSLRTGSFDWTVSDETITLSYTKQSFSLSATTIDQQVIAYTGDMPSKTTMNLEGTETTQYTSGSITQKVFTGTFELEKQ